MPRGKRDKIPETVTLDLIRSILDYDPLTGQFTWKVNRGRRPYKGTIAGNVGKWGYREICFNFEVGTRTRIKAHRIAWFYVTGEWPDCDIDHKNLNRDDNRLENLRKATRGQNILNSGIPKSNVSGHKGVCRFLKKGVLRWRAYITVDRKQHSLGLFRSKDDAALARRMAEAKIYGDFGRSAVQCL